MKITLNIRPAIYSKTTTTAKDREYVCVGTTGPVGTIQEWKEFAYGMGYDYLTYKTLEGKFITYEIKY